MIKINLLKQTGPQKSDRGFPVKPAAVVLLSLCLVAAAVVIVLKNAGNRRQVSPIASVEKKDSVPPRKDAVTSGGTVAGTAVSAKTVYKKPDTVLPASAGKPEPAPVANKSQPVPKATTPTEETKSSSLFTADTSKSKFTPSTHASARVVEEVVLDRNRKSADAVSLAYREMSAGEKINYELAFTRKIFELLTRAVPEGIGFNSLTIDSFSTVKAAGYGPSRELVAGLFRSLRDENLVLRQRPASSIRPVGRQGYRFDFSCEASVGVDTADTFIATSNLRPHENFAGILKSFSRLLSSDGIAQSGGLDRIASEKAGGYRRYSYRFSGSGPYRDFVKFILDVQKKHLPCSFQKIQLKARNDATVGIDAEIVFTLLD